MKQFQNIADLFGRILIREMDQTLLETLQQPEFCTAFAEIGIEFPHTHSIDQLLESLSTDYCAHFLVGSEPIPLVQSVWEGGAYDSESVQALRALADEAGLKFEKEHARSAPIDHLGSILMLWSKVAEDWPDAQEYLKKRHLEWAKAPLRQLAQREGFYPQVASATYDLIEQILDLPTVGT